MAKVTEQKKGTSESVATEASTKLLAVVLVRGLVKVSQPVKDTLALLNLNRKNHCVVIKGNPVNLGMIKKVKDYIAWGEIDEKTYQQLVEKRGEEYQSRLTDRKEKYNYNTLEVAGKKYKPYFRLNPPQKGFGRKGIKVAFKAGGALGYRAEKINDLIIRML